MPRHYKIALIGATVLGVAVAALFIARSVASLAAEGRLAETELLAGVTIAKHDGLTITHARASLAHQDFVSSHRRFFEINRAISGNPVVRALGLVPGLHEQIAAGTNLASAGAHLSTAGGDAVDGIVAFQQQAQGRPHGTPSEKVLDALNVLDPPLAAIDAELGAVANDRSNIPSHWLLPPLSKAVAQFDSQVKLATLRADLGNLRRGEPAVRSILGVAGAKSFLVLQQDPAELRATGGFIGSVGFLNFDNGKMAPFDPMNSYDLDLRNGISVLGPPGTATHVDPPAPIHEAFPLVPSWELRDSNWSPDFPTAAREAEYLLSRETGRRVDGVIAIDPYLIEKLLAVIGPTKVAETGDVVDQSNFFATTIKRVELDPSRNGKSFLSFAAKAIFARLQVTPQTQWLSLLQAVRSGCDDKSIQAYFDDPALEKFVTGTCGGEVVSPNQDGIMIVESNLGANKDDFWLRRQYGVKIAMRSDGSARHALNLHYFGLTRQDVRLTEYLPYLGWLRVYLPASSTIISVAGAKLDPAKDLNRTVLQGWFNVDFNKTTDITITYDLGGPTLAAHNGALELYWQKQAGRPADAITVDFTPAPGSKLDAIHVGTDPTRGGLIESDLSVDRRFTFRFGPS